MKKQPIGVFDSGLGGLTILKALRRKLPDEDLIYFGDTANVPYGSKSKAAVTKFSLAIARFLQTQGVKLIVVACNTASAQALAELRRRMDVPVMGVIEPGARRAADVTRNGRIAVLGTEGTVRSKAYPKAILKCAPKARVLQQACPLFVPLAEESWGQKPAAALIAQEYLKPVQKSGADTVILGCTHYPLLKPVLSRILGKSVRLVDSADTLADAAQAFLAERGQLETRGKGRVQLYASDDPTRFKHLAEKLLSETLGAVRLKKLEYEDIRR